MSEKNRLRVRRALLHGLAVVALGVRAGWARAAKKYAKERVGYSDQPYLGRTCSKCVLYVGHGECAIVEGVVSPDGWCIQWTPATIGAAAGPA